MLRTKIKRPNGQKLVQKAYRLSESQNAELAQGAKLANMEEAELVRWALEQAGIITLEDKASIHKVGARLATEAA